MGTKCAPVYACLFMSILEKKILSTWTGTRPHLFKRYIDDIFFIWHGTVKELQDFLTHMNSCHPYIKFTSEYDYDNKTVAFLDMSISIDQGKIVTDLHKKDTARVQYLLPSSCHPGHVTKNIPFSLGYRLLRICSDHTRFLTRLEELKSDLLSRSYNPKVVDDAFRRVKMIPRSEALKKVERKSSDRECFVIEYHPALPSITTCVRRHWAVMTGQSQKLKRFFPKPSLVAYKRARNLGEILVRAKVSTTRKSSRKSNGYTLCKRLCKGCILSKRATKHSCPRTKKQWDIAAPITCQTTNVIYKLSCRKCDWIYIGETHRRFADRLQEHRGYITQKKLDHPTGAHFNSRGHQPSDLLPLAIERVLPKNDHMLRKCREKFWINEYQSSSYGGNTRE